MSFYPKKWRPRLEEFNDSRLDGFLLDHFPEFHIKHTSGRGLTPDEKINMLLEQCVRDPKMAVTLEHSLIARPKILAYDLPTPYTFDLDQIVNEGLEILLEKKEGLIGLSIPCSNPDFFTYYCRRLALQLGILRGNRDSVMAVGNLPIRTRDVKPSEVFQIIEENVIDKLIQKDIVLHFQVVDNETVEEVWQYLYEKIGSLHLPRRLVIVLPIEEGSLKPPEHAHLLNPPVFVVNDVVTWVTQVIQCLQFPDEVGSEWIKLIVAKYYVVDTSIGQKPHFDTNRLYFHLNTMSNLIERSIDELTPEFLNEKIAGLNGKGKS